MELNIFQFLDLAYSIRNAIVALPTSDTVFINTNF